MPLVRKGCWVKQILNKSNLPLKMLPLVFQCRLLLLPPLPPQPSSSPHHTHSGLRLEVHQTPTPTVATAVAAASVECIFPAVTSLPPHRSSSPSPSTATSAKCHLRHCHLATTSLLSIAATIKHHCHPQLPPLLLPSIAAIKR